MIYKKSQIVLKKIDQSGGLYAAAHGKLKN
jgi:hypothetical protein